MSTSLTLHNPDLIEDLKLILDADKHQLQANIDKIDSALDLLAQRPNLLDYAWFTVGIYDPWDSVTGRPGSGDAAAQGLKEAVEKSESEYMKRSGTKVRDDGVLRYYVYVHLGSKKVVVPDRFWSFYTATGKKEAQSNDA